MMPRPHAQQTEGHAAKEGEAGEADLSGLQKPEGFIGVGREGRVGSQKADSQKTGGRESPSRAWWLRTTMSSPSRKLPLILAMKVP